MNSILELLTQDNYLMYNLNIAKNVGVHEAIMIGELARKYNYWMKQGRLTEDGYFFITQEDIENDTGLSEHFQRKALKTLVDMGIVKIEKKGGLNRANYYKVVDDALAKALTFQGSRDEPSEVHQMNDTNTTYTNTVITNNTKYTSSAIAEDTLPVFKKSYIEKNTYRRASVGESLPIDPLRSELEF